MMWLCRYAALRFKSRIIIGRDSMSKAFPYTTGLHPCGQIVVCSEGEGTADVACTLWQE